MFGKPPDQVPDDGLTAEQYLELARWYEESRLIRQCRRALQKALALQPKGPVAVECKRMLETRIPRVDVPDSAVRRIERAELQQGLKPHLSRRVATKMIEEFPDYERPHRLLAELHLRNGDVQEAIASLENALQLNPEYVPAIGLLARALVIDMEYEAARPHLQRALSAMPNDENLRALQRALEYLTQVEKELAE